MYVPAVLGELCGFKTKKTNKKEDAHAWGLRQSMDASQPVNWVLTSVDFFRKSTFLEKTIGTPLPRDTLQTNNNPLSSSLAPRSTFGKFEDSLMISYMDTNGDLGVMPHVTHLQRTLEFVLGLWIEIRFFRVMVKFHKMLQMSRQMPHL